VAGSCEHSNEPSGSGSTKLVSISYVACSESETNVQRRVANVAIFRSSFYFSLGEHVAVIPLSAAPGFKAVPTNCNWTERKRKLQTIKIALRMFRGSSKYRLSM
jgi:hypothetical protein